MFGTRNPWRLSAWSASLSFLLLGSLPSCASGPEDESGGAPRRAEIDSKPSRQEVDSGGVPPVASEEVTAPPVDKRTQLLEISFPEAIAIGLRGRVSAEEDPPARVVLAFAEASKQPPEEFLERYRNSSRPELREALAHGLAGGRNADLDTLSALLADQDEGVRSAATVALARSRSLEEQRAALAEPLASFTAEQRAILELAPLAATDEGTWPPAVERFVEHRYRAGRALGLVAGEPYTARLLRILAKDERFLRSLLLEEVEAGMSSEDVEAVGACLRPELPSDVLGNVLGRLGARVLATRGALAPPWTRALIRVLLDPFQGDSTAVAVHGLLGRLTPGPWVSVVESLDDPRGPSPETGEAFARLPVEEAIGACVLLGRLGGERARELLSSWKHSDESVQEHLMAARVAAGAPVSLLVKWFEPFPTRPLEEQIAMLELLGRTGVARRHAALLEPFQAVRDPEIAILVLLTTWRAEDPREEFLAELAVREETEPWRGRAASVLLRSQVPRPRLLEFVRVTRSAPLLRAWAAWEIRQGTVNGLGFLQAALQNLDDAGAMLAARELRLSTGVMGLEDLLLAGLNLTADPLVRARLGRLLGELGSARVLERLPQQDPALDAAYGAALFGQALQKARREREERP